MGKSRYDWGVLLRATGTSAIGLLSLGAFGASGTILFELIYSLGHIDSTIFIGGMASLIMGGAGGTFGVLAYTCMKETGHYISEWYNPEEHMNAFHNQYNTILNDATVVIQSREKEDLRV